MTNMKARIGRLEAEQPPVTTMAPDPFAKWDRLKQVYDLMVAGVPSSMIAQMVGVDQAVVERMMHYDQLYDQLVEAQPGIPALQADESNTQRSE